MDLSTRVPYPVFTQLPQQALCILPEPHDLAVTVAYLDHTSPKGYVDCLSAVSGIQGA